ncbi:MAG: hypothetical protein A3G32_08495 [Deltaproteobacteria bacterium RIFCSPLOWO2_12_FULL_40_28]|nr:MAG: hypothetical protein A3C45_01195 [Deltaproteobacteria bacterium RIFCSPHIGHO2_02_FULL_40_28]OGQ20942.1 MAG: hypothetical protein A3E27_03860 [Deltaproteobacteria bacterium RIFCSPHIGHO2_12_FULL_40_32]OGQ39343.1 MAG: hypothetical protein A3I69_05220 [Deltaproteobacteria bacterium RIFCSPLOWO2_02_FULL_40_36]OGQ54624.1 MAG: hypothetical protein A3G32_08495 [Deltaproteobacteria bacterium RIFCSPLOWO2_12_FULL_40_28]
MSYETITVGIEAGVATITINRPKVLNALNETVLTELTKAFRDLKKEASLRAAIITGSGDKSFVAGADIAVMQEMTPLEAKAFVDLGHKCMHAIETAFFPVIAAVNGFALGGGLELALACDFIYASKNAKLGLPEVNLGIFPGFGGTQRLSRLIGKNKAKELIYTAKILNADEALGWGIVNSVYEPADLLGAVKKTIDTILKKGPVAISLVKRVINDGTDLDLTSGLSLEALTFPVIFSTEDKKEGVKAFLEKREAKFIGR